MIQKAVTLRIDDELRALLPPLSTDEKAALADDIERNGQMVPVVCDEDGVILDGMHRFDVLGDDCQYNVSSGLSPAEKKAFTYRANFVRRNLSPDQKSATDKSRKVVYFELRDAGYTQKDAAAAVGASRSTSANWDALHNVQQDKTQQT